ncbi:MAG: hypothetical protein WC966_09650 [Bradymonadales bacterium]
MSKERQAEILELPTSEESDKSMARRVILGRNTVERYVERLENAAQHLKMGPEAAEIYCALAELRDGLIENNLSQALSYYTKAVDAFSLSRPANLGMRRIARARREADVVVKSYERELLNASEQRSYALKTGLARCYLQLENKSEEALSLLQNEKALVEDLDSDSQTADGHSEQEQLVDFDVERFFLIEDALWAKGDWDAYEQHLREALSAQTTASDFSKLIETRLFFLYRYILADEKQSDLLFEHLAKKDELDPELVEYHLEIAERKNNRDAVVEILSKALDAPACKEYRALYRLILANVVHYQYEDLGHAANILRDGVEEEPDNALLVSELLALQQERGDKEALLQALTLGLDSLETANAKAQALYKIACILRDELEQDEAALELIVEANVICPSHGPSLLLLKEHYRKEELWSELAELYEQELHYAKINALEDYSLEVFIDKLSQLAEIYEYRLGYHLKAFGSYQQLLAHKADDLAALKGAARMTASIGNWTELLQLYAKAENCTQDKREHVYLLERIADIAENYLNDDDTACTALEAVILLEPQRQSAITNLARIYWRLERYEELIKLNDAEVEFAGSAEYKATLLCVSGDIARERLSNEMLAIQYFERARALDPKSRKANEALLDCYENQEAWEKILQLLKAQIEVLSDASLKCAKLHRMAEIYENYIDEPEKAIDSYERCLELKPTDLIAQAALLEHYKSVNDYNAVIRIMMSQAQAQDENSDSPLWLSLFRIGQIYQFRLHNNDKASELYQRACNENPDHYLVFKSCYELQKTCKNCDELQSFLLQTLEKCSNDAVKSAIYLALADIDLAQLKDDDSALTRASAALQSAESITGYKRIYSNILAPAYAQQGRWTERLLLASAEQQCDEEQKHGLLGAIALSFPPEIRERAHEILCGLEPNDETRMLWASLSPAQRPSIHRVHADLLTGSSHDAQDLRRWVSIQKLLEGKISDPTQELLPDDRDENMSYRPDLELLASYFEIFEKWHKLLEVLSVQEENTRNEQERIQVIIQRAWILTKIQQPQEALKSIQEACVACSYANPMRLSLYDYLKQQEDWDFLVEQIRQHIINCDDPSLKSELWQRLSEIYDVGLDKQDESLRCLDQAYREDPKDGKLLTAIAQLAGKIGEIAIARRALDDYLQFHQPSVEEQIKLAPKMLELHFMHEGGNKAEVLMYFERLAVQSADAREILEVLAKCHAIAGDPAKAAEIILRLMRIPFESEDIELWLILCDLYAEKLNQAPKAEDLLWSLFARFPERSEIFKKLDATYQSREERRILVENIKTHINDGDAFSKQPELARKYLGFAAQILGSELGIWQEAQDLYSEAIAKAEIPQPDLVKNRAYARCRIPGEAKSAYAEFSELIVTNPFDEDIIRAAIEICRRNEAIDRERILQQIAKTFIPERGIHLENQPVRPKVDINRAIPAAVLQKHLIDPQLALVQELLHEALPILDSLFKEQLPRRSLLGGSRTRSPEIQALFNSTTAALNLGNVRVYLAHDSSPVPMVFDNPNAFWLPTDHWEGASEAEKRHWAAYASGLLWTSLSRVVHYDMKELWHTLDAAYYLTNANCIQERNALSLDFAERIKSPWLRRERKEIARIIDETTPEKLPLNSAPAWKTAIYATADRAALLFSGDLSTSFTALLAAEVWDKSRMDRQALLERLQKSPRLQALIRFALSDDYLQLRYYAGLAARPSEISG